MKLRLLSAMFALLLMLSACANGNSADLDTPDTVLPADVDTTDTETTPAETTAPPEEKEKEITEVKYNGYIVKIHEHVVVAQSPDVSRKGAIPWGGYQFPSVRLAFNNNIAVSFHMGADSIVSGSSYSRTFLSRSVGGSLLRHPRRLLRAEDHLLARRQRFVPDAHAGLQRQRSDVLRRQYG